MYEHIGIHIHTHKWGWGSMCVLGEEYEREEPGQEEDEAS